MAVELCRALRRRNTGADWISTDAFLKNRIDRNRLGISGYNARSIDARALAEAVETIASGQEYTYHPYDNRAGMKASDSRTLSPQPIVIIEGIHALHHVVRGRCGLRMFIDSDDATLIEMRARANMRKRGMDERDARMLIQDELKEFQDFILPNKAFANVLIKVDVNYDYELGAAHA